MKERNDVLTAKRTTWIFFLAAILCSANARAQVSTRLPFCLQGQDDPGWSNCSFTSYQECQASASGAGGECVANPWYRPGDNAPDENAAGPVFSPLPVGPPPD
jgi:Protein of unknown function (DUF3551)